MSPRKRKIAGKYQKIKGPEVEELKKRFKPLRNRTREYLDLQTGARVSNRQYKKAVLTGGISLEQLAKQRKEIGMTSTVTRYGQLLDERQAYLKSQGVQLTRGQIRTSPEMKVLVKDLRTKSNSYRGRKARALVQLGLRDETWTFAVGETPK